MISLGHDPGIQGPSWAVAKDNVLAACNVVRGPDLPAFTKPTPGQVAHLILQDIQRTVPEVDKVYVEQMVHYPPGRTTKKLDERARTAIANDLIMLSSISGIVVGSLCAPLGVRYFPPGTWKGRVDKKVTKHRVEKALTPPEVEVLNRALAGIIPSLRHNLYDAIGILFVGLGRIPLP